MDGDREFDSVEAAVEYVKATRHEDVDDIKRIVVTSTLSKAWRVRSVKYESPIEIEGHNASNIYTLQPV